MQEYDVVVLGSGPGGYVSAIRSAQLGAKTAIIEQTHIGGTCLNVGCIPTKSLAKNVEIIHSIKLGKKRGIKIDGELTLDFKKAIKTKNNSVKQLVGGVQGLLDSYDIDVYIGKGVVDDNRTINIKDESEDTMSIGYKKLIIGTGSSSLVPPIPGADTEGVLTSEELLTEGEVPEHLIVVGGGVIGCEFASIYNAYGSNVTIVEMLPGLVAMLDQSISDHMSYSLESEGIGIKLNQQVKKISKNMDGKLAVLLSDSDGSEETLIGDRVLISVGRSPNIQGLEALSLKTKNSYICVNERQETNIPGVYAIGDVTGIKTLAHVASEMGIIAAENALGLNKSIDLNAIPSCIYTVPEISSVGLSEKEAIEKGFEVIVGNSPLIACGKAVAVGEPEGNFKVIADKKTRKILGAHLIGKSATEIVAEAVAFIRTESTIDDVANTIHAHPTISESFAEAVRDIDGYAIHLPNKRRK